MLSERKDDRMTVTEIARRANIDRKTFYLHYANPDDVLKKYSKRLASKIMQTLEENGFFDDSDLMMMISIKFYTAGIMSIFASYLRHEIEITDSELIGILSELTTSGFSKRLIEN